MEVNTINEIAVNRRTLIELLKPVIAFVQEHDKMQTRTGLFEEIIDLVADGSNITPIVFYGAMQFCIMSQYSKVREASRLLGMLGTSPTANKDIDYGK